MLLGNNDPYDVWDGRKKYVAKNFDGIDQDHLLIEYQCVNGIIILRMTLYLKLTSII